ncbi:MAG: hypothetical protein ACXACY_31310, partial [Candidatus Hodarchaeales archaeon]
IIVGDTKLAQPLDFIGKFYDLKSINSFQTYSDSKYAANKNLFLGISTTRKQGNEKYVLFKAYLSNFSYAKKPNISDVDTNANPAGVVYDYKAGIEKEWNIFYLEWELTM